MSDDDATSVMPVGPEPAPPPPRAPATNGTKWLIGLLVVALLVIGAGVAVFALGGDDDSGSSAVSTKRARHESSTSSSSGSTSTSAPTTSTLVAGSATTVPSGPTSPPVTAAKDGVPGGTTTPAPTVKTSPPAITTADEPTFTSVMVPVSYMCGDDETFTSVKVTWATAHATSVSIHTSGNQPNLAGLATTGSAFLNLSCTDGSPTTLGVQFSAQGPGGSAVATRSMSIVHA